MVCIKICRSGLSREIAGQKNRMRMLFVADGRSPIAQNWIEYFLQTGHEVHLASTYPCDPDIRLASFIVIPVSFGAAAGEQKDDIVTYSPTPLPYPILDDEGGKRGDDKTGVRLTFSLPAPPKKSLLRSLLPVGLRTAIRQRLGPSTLPSASRRLKLLISYVQPDLIHAMRIPYEGMLAALAQPSCPLLISVWGNDLTLHAPSTHQMAKLTRQALQSATALHTDCVRDLRLAACWGYPARKPALTVPGAGGVRRELFKIKPNVKTGVDKNFLVINPRGMRAYVRNDTFFQAIPAILKQIPQMHFICPGMAGEVEILNWVEKLDISRSVTLLPHLTRADMATLFSQSDIAVSITEHDGTPNTLLEAMACGCFPIAGDIETLREWITPGINGLLVPPGDAQALADAVILAFMQPDLCSRAREVNLRLVEEKADYAKIMPKALAFYESLIQ